MVYDYSRLKGRITARFGETGRFARAMKMSEKGLHKRLCGEKERKQGEISGASLLLGIDAKQIDVYFFTVKVQHN